MRLLLQLLLSSFLDWKPILSTAVSKIININYTINHAAMSMLRIGKIALFIAYFVPKR